MDEVVAQANGGKHKYGSIDTPNALKNNLKQNAIPDLIFNATHKDYVDFLEQRRKLMAIKIEKYYKTL